MNNRQEIQKKKSQSGLVKMVVLLGKLFSSLFRPNSETRIFLIGSRPDAGDINKINTAILSAFAEEKAVIIYTKGTKKGCKTEYPDIEGVRILDIHNATDYSFLRVIDWFYRGVISKWINKSARAVVIGNESDYFYKLLPWIDKDVATIDVSHSQSLFYESLPFIDLISKRVFSNEKLMQHTIAHYRDYGIDEHLAERITFIGNIVPLFERPYFSDNEVLEVLFINGKSETDRLDLTIEIAKMAHQRRVPVHFSFLGIDEHSVNTQSLKFCSFYNEMDDEKRLDILKKSDVLLSLSRDERLPLDMMTMMALGKTIVAVAVNAVPEYIKDGVNGYLLPGDSEDKKVAEDTIIALSILAHDRYTLREMGQKNFDDANVKFSKELFEKKWKQILDKVSDSSDSSKTSGF